MKEIVVTSWHELNERLYEQTWQPSLGRFRGPFAYRGVSWALNDLRTTLLRLNTETESHILRNFRKYAHRDSVPGDSLWNWLALAQDRKSTRLNSSHSQISYAVFCLKK